MKKLLIVESPGKVKKIQSYLGPDWLVRASVGHIRQLAKTGDSALGFEMRQHTIRCTYVPQSERAKQTVAGLKKAARSCSEVYLATDKDREGETIAWHLKDALGLKQPKRVVYGEISRTAILKAIKSAGTLNDDLVAAGRCRDCLDKLVGYKGSPIVWDIGAKSVGRVQSATLHILCQREREILAFQPRDYWTVSATYRKGFQAFYTKDIGSSSPPEERHESDASNELETPQKESTRVLSQTKANQLVALARSQPHKVVSVDTKTVLKSPPAPFTTSTLQQGAGSKLKLSPEQTMSLAQKLYEKGLITYMRTDSVELSDDYCATARKWLQAKDPDNVPTRQRKYRPKKGAQEAHEAIRPVDMTRPSQELRTELTPEEFDLYVLIWKRALASQCKPARLGKTKVTIQVRETLWTAKGQVVEFYGYAKYWSNLSAPELLPPIARGAILTLERAESTQKKTQPPPRYSEPKIVQVMEQVGIGRPSTYASTVKTLKERDYVAVVRKTLQPTELGLKLDAFLMKGLPELIDAKFTARMENELDAIAAGKQEWQHYLCDWNASYFEGAIANARKVLSESGLKVKRHINPKARSLSRTKCPECKTRMAKIPSKKVEKGYFLKCVGECDDLVMFWSKYAKAWQRPRPRASSPPD
ncbi:MAG: type I DNA topoisomerase [Cyanobacteria bacterium J06642_2]